MSLKSINQFIPTEYIPVVKPKIGDLVIWQEFSGHVFTNTVYCIDAIKRDRIQVTWFNGMDKCSDPRSWYKISNFVYADPIAVLLKEVLNE